MNTNPVFNGDLFDIADAQVRTRESFQDLARTVIGVPLTDSQQRVVTVLNRKNRSPYVLGVKPPVPLEEQIARLQDGLPFNHIHHWIRRDIDLADVCQVCGKVVPFERGF